MTSPAANNEPGKPRSGRPTAFLARYPRNLKLAAIVVLVAVFTASWFIQIPLAPPIGKSGPHGTALQIERADEKATKNAAQESPSAVPAARSADVNTIINNQDDHSIKLAPAPASGLSEDTAEGSLPRISEDGRQPWQVYARPFNTADKRPRIGIVIADLGLSRATTDAAISRLPANVTLAFDVQSPVVGAWCARARQDGHETLLQLPMEPFDYPRSDPGPNTLLTSLSNSENLTRLLWALRQSTGYVGVTTFSGSRFTTDSDKLVPILDTLHSRGLMVFDARLAPHSAIIDMAGRAHVPTVGSTTRIDQDPSPEAIDASLDQLEKTARLTGHAIGIASPLPAVIDRLQVWTKSLPERGVALAPVSAMVQ